MTVFPTHKNDTRQATGGTSVTVYEPGPTATVSGPDEYDAFNTPGPFTFTAAANEPWGPSRVLRMDGSTGVGRARWLRAQTFATGPASTLTGIR